MKSKTIEVFTLPFFERRLKYYAKKNPFLLKKDYEYLLDLLEENPINDFSIYLKDEAYKLRLKNSSSNKGKSSGYRVYYFYRSSKNKVILFYIHSKSDESNISDEKLDKLIMECKLFFNDNIL